MTPRNSVDGDIPNANRGVGGAFTSDRPSQVREEGVAVGPGTQQRGQDFPNGSLKSELMRETFEGLLPVSIGSAILWLLFVPFHWMDLAVDLRVRAMLVDLAMAVTALGLYMSLRKGWIRIGWVGPATLLFVLASTTGVLANYMLAEQAVQSFYVGVILIAAGSIILMTRWWVCSSVCTLVAWAFVATHIVTGSELANLIYVQGSALMVSIAAHVGRTRSVRRVFEFRERDRVRESELQGLLAETDQARRELDVRVEARTRELRLAYDDLRAQVKNATRLEGQRRDLEADLHHAQRMESIGQLAGGIAHDFNNLLTVITGNMDIVLQLGGSIDKTQRSCLEDARAAAERAADLTGALLAYSRKQPVVLTTLSPVQVLEGMHSMIQQAAAESIDVDLAIEPVEGLIRGGRGQVEQVVMNLVLNACDAMPMGGQLRVELDEVDRIPGSLSSAELSGPHVRLRVTDTGCGMDEQTQEKALEPFFTTKDVGQGTGLGLSVVDGIVRQHGGHVVLESVPGSGTTVSVYFPVTLEGVLPGLVPSGASPSDMAAQGAALTVLLVEDEEAVRRFTTVLLEELGHHVLTAENGGQALATAESYEGEIDLLVTDVMMPGMVGTELAQKMGLARPTIRVLLVSGYTDPRGVSDLESQEGVAFLQKPFTLKSLNGQIQNLMESQRT
ncbi:MAG TPA: response regulator [Planctomycetes bacterium]|nr:response regulator [Planctomycetota bacterium]HIK59547.1 response regulator [Planctomycetota bacterium]